MVLASGLSRAVSRLSQCSRWRREGIAAYPSSDFLTPRPAGTLALGWRADRSGVMPAPAPFARRLPASSLRPPVPGQPWSHDPDRLLWTDSVLQWRDAD